MNSETESPLVIKDRMRQLIKRYYRWNRVPVGEQTSRFARELAAVIDGRILSARSGEECLTWVTPPRWTVRQAFLETSAGERLADFDTNPLYLKSYSAAFSGMVSREELIPHLFSDPKRPERIIYDVRAQYGFGERKAWGFSLPHRVVESLKEDQYKVHIDVEFGSGELDVVDCKLPGEIPDTIFFAAHTCHPAQVNDGIACIAVIVELLEWLKRRPQRRWSYRMIFGPEYYAAAVLLSRGADIQNLKCGFFLDMLGNGQQLGFSHSFHGSTYVDRAMTSVLKDRGAAFIERPYRKLWGNDEMFYDGPGFEIPTIGLGRAHFENYHTDQDNLENCDFDQLVESLCVLQDAVELFESDCIPVRRYTGPLYLTRYGLYVDPLKNRAGYDNLQNIQILMDGTRSCLDIAAQLGIEFKFVRDFCRELESRNLAELRKDKPIAESNSR